MERYKNLGHNSAVYQYDIADTSITVRFKDGGEYIYTYASAGQSAIEDMKILADRGQGLGTYINKNVRKAYAKKVA